MAQPRTKYDDREEVFVQIIDELNPLNDRQLKSLAKDAGCSHITLYNWRSGRVRAPRVDKLFPVARALGYHIRLFGTGKKRPALRRVK